MAHDGFVWDDRTWDQVWERMLGPVERRAIARDVWRVTVPREPFTGRVAVELARRWQRTARNLVLLYGLWTLFWGGLAVADLRRDGALDGWLPLGCAAAGAAAILACAAFRRRLRPVATAHRHRFTDPYDPWTGRPAE